MPNNYGITGKVLRDDDPLNPVEEYEDIGTMVCQHRRYNLGHIQGNPHTHLEGKKNLIKLPLYLMDHSGLSISTKDFGCPWDSGIVGVIYAEKGVEGMSDDDIRKCLEGEVKTYNDYLQGNCWGYVITDKDGEHIDSCYGFLGNKEYCEKEMEANLEIFIKAEGNRLKIRNEKLSQPMWVAEVVDGNTVLGLEEWRENGEVGDGIDEMQCL